MKIKNLNNIKSIFFDNLTIKQTIFKNIFWIASSHVVIKFLKFILFIYIARILGAVEYGKFTFALAFVGLFIAFSSFGMNPIFVREFTKDEKKQKDFSDILSLKMLLGFFVLIITWIGSFFITIDVGIQKIIWILALYSFFENLSNTIHSFFHTKQKMEYQSYLKIFEGILLFIIGIFMIFNFPSVKNLAYVYLLSMLISLFVALVFFNLKIQKINLSFNTKIWVDFLKVSWPLALVSFSDHISRQADSVIMGFLGQINETGLYNAASRIIAMCLVPAGLIANSFYPALSKISAESKEKFQKIWNYQTKIMAAIAFPLMAGGIILAPRIINFIYGYEFNDSILVFKILLITIGIVFFYINFERALIIFDKQKVFFGIVAFSAIINLILNLILIPKISLYGAALSSVLTHLLILFLLVKYSLKFTPVKPFNKENLLNLIGIILSSLVMYFIISLPKIYSLNLIAIVLIGATIYFFCFLGYKKLLNQIILIRN